MSYYISTATIKKAYEELASLDYSNQSILHIFFILKGIGINNLKYEDVDIIKRQGIPYAQDLSGLFSDLEKQPEKCDFINPFMMNEWRTNPTEKLNKWVSSRIKNNIIGGATTWRKIIMQDTNGDFKFVFDYIEQIKEVTIDDSGKIPLEAIAIWANRFTEFDEKVSVTKIIDSFLNRYHFNQNEKNELFRITSHIKNVTYENDLHDTEAIRQLIGAPKGLSDWELSKPVTGTIELANTIMRRFNMSTINKVDTALLMRILKYYHQLILSGPPGTSKSYLCGEVSRNYDETFHVQFHPQYSYQQFVGGYVVDGTEVHYKNGLMLDIIENATVNDSKKYLIIIDEINRANTSQVFGDLIQCLDRNNKVDITCDGVQKEYSIPKNIDIIGTMNTTDRTIGALDYALKRRFLDVYCGSNPQVLAEMCPNNGFISLSDFLEKINANLYDALKNREMCIGHAMFLNEAYKGDDGKFNWDFESFELLFNYKIVPLVEEYCYGNQEQIYEILGDKLPERLTGDEFKQALEEYMK